MLTGKIAAIIDESSVVINLGAQQGVKTGTRFKANFRTKPITDPDNPENKLDGLSFEIAVLIAVTVLDKFSYCKILDPYEPKGFEFPAGSFFGTVTKGQPKVGPEQSLLADPDAKKLRVGTPVIEISEKEAAERWPAKS